jgi:hypothetical protein
MGPGDNIALNLGDHEFEFESRVGAHTACPPPPPILLVVALARTFALAREIEVGPPSPCISISLNMCVLLAAGTLHDTASPPPPPRRVRASPACCCTRAGGAVLGLLWCLATWRDGECLMEEKWGSPEWFRREEVLMHVLGRAVLGRLNFFGKPCTLGGAVGCTDRRMGPEEEEPHIFFSGGAGTCRVTVRGFACTRAELGRVCTGGACVTATAPASVLA